MRGKSKYKKRTLSPDEKFNSVYVSQFINKLIHSGKKETAKNIFYDAIELAAKERNLDPMDVFNDSIKNTAPIIEVKSKRVGGATYQVPVEVKPARKTALAIKWLIEAAGTRNGKSMSESLAHTFVESSQNLGPAIKKREDVHKMAEANRAFAHYARL